jgi:hypothetical protein
MTQLSSDRFMWRKGRGTASCNELGLRSFPQGQGGDPAFTLRSHRTGAVRRFYTDRRDMEQNEFYDGEAQTYLDSTNTVRISIRA